MGEVGIHLNHVLVTLIKRPLEAGNVGSTQALLAGSLEDMNAVRTLGDHLVHDGSRAIGRVVIDDEHIKLVFTQGEHGIDDVPYVLLLVISRNNY